MKIENAETIFNFQPSLFNLEVKSHGYIPLRLSFEYSVHLPCGIYPHKISEQGAAGTETITTCKGTDTSGFHFKSKRRGNIGNVGPFDFIVSTVPGGSQVYKLYNLEIAEEGIIDRFFEQGFTGCP